MTDNNNTSNALPTLFQQYIAASKYSRWLEDEQRREVWPEPARRYVENVVRPVLTDAGLKKKDIEAVCERAFNAISTTETLPSMRALMTAGPALDRDHMAGYNCSYIAIDHPRAFDEALYILSCGTGLGFSVERQFIGCLPEVAEEFNETDTTIVVADSKIGWASSFRELIGLLYSGRIPKIDVSKVRPAGARLRTFGGRASGPGPLVELFEYAIRTFRAAAGRKLNSLECHGLMCKIGEAIVVGGVRRSALISLSNLTDQRLRNAKSGNWSEQHPEYSLANNSVAYTEKPDTDAFMQEWLALYQSKSGERGVFNRAGAKRKMKRLGRRDPDHEWGGNPCVTGDTQLLTEQGYQPIGELVGQPVRIWNGAMWSEVTPFSTGVNDLVRVHLSDGSTLDTTPYHKFLVIEGFNNAAAERVEAGQLREGDKLQKWEMPVVNCTVANDPEIDAYSQGFYSGDGNTDYTFSYLYDTKYACEDRLAGTCSADTAVRKRWKHGEMLSKTFVPINASVAYKLNWLAGLLDSDGTVTRDENGNGFQVVSVNKKFLLDVRLLLSTLGCRVKIIGASEAGLRMMPDGRGGKKEYECQKSHRLLIGNTDAYSLLQLGLRLNRLDAHDNPPQRDARQYVKVLRVEKLEERRETFCVTEPILNQMTVNGIVTGNCLEILLRSMQTCNLTEVVIRPNDTLETLKKKVELATILGTIQSTFTSFRYLRPTWKRNIEEERLLGVSFTGIYDHPVMSGQISYSDRDPEDWLEELRKHAVATNRAWAEKLGINPSTAITCCKPAGTTSLLSNTASGIHPRHSEFYIRAVRQDNKDALTRFLKDQGVPNEPCVMRPESTTVFYFPLAAPEGSITKKDLKAIDHLELWNTYNTHWAEHTVSVTVSVQEHEWMEVGAWVFNNFDNITGISFLPADQGTYKQAPFQACSFDEYRAAMEKMPASIDWSQLSQYETEDETTGSRELACTGGACEIP